MCRDNVAISKIFSPQFYRGFHSKFTQKALAEIATDDIIQLVECGIIKFIFEVGKDV